MESFQDLDIFKTAKVVRINYVMNSIFPFCVSVVLEKVSLSIADEKLDEVNVILHDRVHHNVSTSRVHCLKRPIKGQKTI